MSNMTPTRRLVQAGPNMQQISKSISYFGVTAKDAAKRFSEARLDVEKWRIQMPPNASPRGLNGPRDIPETWKSALRKVRSLFPEALLVGGALRDRDNDVAVKDLDIFVEARSSGIDAVMDAQQYIKNALGWDTELLDATVYVEWFGANRIIGILRVKLPSMPAVELIFCDFPTNPESGFSRVDFGSSQIAFDGSVIYKTENYEHDRRMKQFRLVTEADDRQMVRRLTRWARLREKYPKWDLNLGVMGNASILPWTIAAEGDHIIKMYGV